MASLIKRIAAQYSQLASLELPLHYDTIGNRVSSKVIVFLHGLLGSGRNLRSFSRAFSNNQAAVGYLLDLPAHGQSRGRRDSFSASPMKDGVHDLQITLDKLGVTASDDWTLVGHSMGGRLSLLYTDPEFAPEVERRRPDRLVLLDTVPKAVSPTVLKVIDVARNVREEWQKGHGELARTNKELVELFVGDEYGLDKATAMWLVTSVNRQTRDFIFDIDLASQLLDDMNALSDNASLFPDQIQRIMDGTMTQRVDLVRGGRNTSWKQPEAVAQLQQLEKIERKARTDGKTFHIHVLSNAGHWVHSDDQKGLLEALAS